VNAEMLRGIKTFIYITTREGSGWAVAWRREVPEPFQGGDHNNDDEEGFNESVTHPGTISRG
jgi:hypothetical protein